MQKKQVYFWDLHFAGEVKKAQTRPIQVRKRSKFTSEISISPEKSRKHEPFEKLREMWLSLQLGQPLEMRKEAKLIYRLSILVKVLKTVLLL